MFVVEEDISIEIKVKNSLLHKCRAGFSHLFAHRYSLAVPGLALVIVLFYSFHMFFECCPEVAVKEGQKRIFR